MPTPTEMSVREIIYYLQETGHQITYYQRKDGGVLIRSIDGIKYLGAKGNIAARALVGVGISEARKKQLKYATKQRGRKKVVLSQDIESEYKRVKRLWKKAFKSKAGKPHHAGYFGIGRIEFAYTHLGKEEALRRIHEAERYASGLAYTKNIEHLIEYIREANLSLKSPELEKLANDIEENIYWIKENAIYPAYKELYELNHGASAQEVARKVRLTLSL